MSEIKKNGSSADTDIKKTTTNAVKPVEAVKKAAASVKASVAPKAAEEIKKPAAEVKKAAAEVKSEVKKAAAATKATAAAAKKRTAARKPAVKKAAAPKMNSAVYIQFNDLNISSEGLVTRVKEIWAERGNKEADLKDVKVYVNVAESKAYYVVNEDIFGEFDL
ncbi:MAG: DUF6465 family protein [Lachnospiraceae bacterium]|jgi:septal ring-binding cell division protein DamX|nr:DUF6465 family protein [Lachnospiraceae bacterium]MCI1327457.1 DUF6465 family protein [Lachnospiraceae bacterium]